MNSDTWSNIYRAIEDRMWRIQQQRGQDAIAIASDPLALEWQRLERINNHVGCHGFAQRDREHGMVHYCIYKGRR